MNIELLLKQFGPLTESPDSIQKLRNFILELAVHGKLVSQDANDEPASELLKRIESEKKRLIKTGEIEKSNPLPAIREDERPYKLPHGWTWLRLGEIMRKMGAGSTPLGGKKVYIENGVPFLRSQNVWNDGLRLDGVARISRKVHEQMNGTHVKDRDVLLNITGASIGRCAVVPSSLVEANVSQHVAILRLVDIELAEYLHICATSPMFQRTIMDVQVGVSREGLSMTRLKLFRFPLPPLAEQHRIVTKVNELMHLCDQLEKERSLQQQLHDCTTKSFLYHLPNAPSNRAALTYWKQAERHFAELFDRPTTIEELRSAILQLAVQGRLVSQNPNDEPASELLQHIEVERKRLVEAGEITKLKPLLPINEDEKPYELQQGWEWVRLGFLCKKLEYGTSEKTLPELKDGVGVYTMGHIQGGTIVDRHLKYLSASSNELPRLYLEKYDLLFNRTNSYELVGKSALYLGESKVRTFASYLIRVSLFNEMVDCFYINYYLNSRVCRETQIEPEITKQTNQANFNGTKLSNILLPLPPLDEQKRIVAKIDELMQLCNQLEEAAAESNKFSRRLMDSILYHLIDSLDNVTEQVQ